jgi:hypothetical protein
VCLPNLDDDDDDDDNDNGESEIKMNSTICFVSFIRNT